MNPQTCIYRGKSKETYYSMPPKLFQPTIGNGKDTFWRASHAVFESQLTAMHHNVGSFLITTNSHAINPFGALLDITNER